MVAATGVGEATLRAWERRFGFPAPRREPSGHRRYSREEVERIRSVVRERGRGLSLAVAIERVTAEPSGPPSLFAPLRERRPDLLPVPIRKRQMLHLSRAVEEESAARAERALMIGAFQRPEFYRAQRGALAAARPRRRADLRPRHLRGGARARAAARSRCRSPTAEPVADEWAVICLAPGYSACLIGWETVGADRAARRASAPSTRCSRSSPRWSAKWRAPRSRSPPRANRRIAERARAYLDRIPDSSQRSQLRLAGAITARAFARMRYCAAPSAIRSSRPTRARRAAG